MAFEDYNKALKRGEKAYKEALSRGEYPYLQVLEELLNHESIVSEVSLGLTEIPSDAIKGTLTAGRRTAFAPNYMPLLDASTEFASKWSALCDAHIKEGIHDAVKAYEYMHRYYIMEGNKRVSVLKYFNAPSIPGTVTRLIPKRTDSEENRVYFEYLDFYKYCPVNYLVFTKPGSYLDFIALAGKESGVRWTLDELADLKALFVRFSQAYAASPSFRGLGIEPSDALLVYLKLMGYQESLRKTPDLMKEELLKIRDEILLLQEKESVELVAKAEEAPKKGLIESLFAPAKKNLRIAFIYMKTPEDSAWTYGHELGRLHVAEVFGNEIETVVYQNVDPGKDIDETLEKAVSEGADVIFATTRLYMDACLKAAIKYPKVKILACTLNAAHRYIRTYYARMYEAKYLSGILAGIMTKNGKIGYLSDYPLPMNLLNINAFALGVRSVNPDADIHLLWTSVIGTDPEAYFRSQEIRIISGRELITPASKTRMFGLYQVDENENLVNLAMPLFNWGILYKKLIDSIRDGNWEDIDKKSGQRALNYWWGMESDAIDILYSAHVPEETKKFLNFLSGAIRNGSLSPFRGRISAKNGPVSEDENHIFTLEELMKTDWLCDNIVGHIPALDELTPEGKAVMLVQGTRPEPEKPAVSL